MKMLNQAWMPKVLALMAAVAVLGMAGCSGSSTNPLAATQIALTASATSVNINGSVTLTATLSSGSSSQAPIGVVTFYDGATSLQAVDVTGKTSVSFSTTTLALGANSLTAVYGGDQAHAASTSPAVVVTVSQTTSTTVTASPAIAGLNQPVVLTATVTAGTNTASGMVSFNYGATVLGTASLVSSPTGTSASITTSALPLGTDSITATFLANGQFSTSTSAPITVQVVSFTPTSTVLTTSPTGTIASGATVTLTAAITPTVVKSALTGTVTFYDGTVNLGTATVSGQTASLTAKQFVVGSNSLTAVYSGDINYGASTSSAAAITLTAYAGATYTNPLNLTDNVNKTGKVYNCPDPAIIKSQTGGTDTWYAYCTGDAFNSTDTVSAGGAFRQHLISIFSSPDLINWTYVRDAFSALPSWVAANNELQTPAIKLIGSTYYLYYEAPATKASPNGSAIGVGTASTPAGPFTDAGAPVINQQLACGGTCNRTVFSPEVIADQSGQYWIAYGGIYAGLSIRQLGPTYTTSVASTEVNIAIDNYYTNPYMMYQNGYYYEFASPAGACCSGAFSTYSVRVGRSKSITGPYLDAEGNDMNAYAPTNSGVAPPSGTVAAPGGDTVLVNTGNTIYGPGSNTVFADESGQYYIFYSGVSSNQQYLPNATGYTARQLMMDPLDWVNGWPVARNGTGDSDAAQPVPAAQPSATNGYVPPLYAADKPGTLMTAYSQDFTSSTSFNSEFSFIHQNPNTICQYDSTGNYGPIPGDNPGFSSAGYTLCSNFAASDSSFAGDTMAQLPILAEAEPTGNYLLEVKLHSLTPPTACCTLNYSSQGLMVYNTDSSYLRLDEFADFDTRQIEFLDEFGSLSNLAYAPVGTPNYTGSTYLRVAKRINATTGAATYTSYSSVDGVNYVRGPAWVVTYSTASKIGIFSGNTAYGAIFSYIHVSTLTP
jgi:arabinan endo-1,5-alpha-L-arabinosidase